MNKIILKKGKEQPIINRHHWIFSGAVEKKIGLIENGEIVEVLDYKNQLLGQAYVNNKTSIIARMLNFSDVNPLVSIRQNIRDALELRKRLFDDSVTNAYRLINGEADRIPGLIIDRYADILVFQISTLGIEKLKNDIIEFLALEINPRLMYEKSNMPSRRHEGLENFEGVIWKNPNIVNEYIGDIKVNIIENNMHFEIDIVHSHKTGFYLDQRNMRALIKSLSSGKRVLNCFSYTGGFSIAAALGGARHVTSVDISAEVINQAQKNFILNELPTEPHSFEATDTFKYFENLEELNSDIVILDPPAFAKKKEDLGAAKSGYKRLNRITFEKMKKGSLLLTCSCSYHMDEATFLEIIKEAAFAAKREVKIIQKHNHAMDHVINLYHEEMNYLKSFLLWVE